MQSGSCPSSATLPCSQIAAHRSRVQLLLSRAMCLDAADTATVAAALGQPLAEHHGSLQAEKKLRLDEADRALTAALRLLHGPPAEAQGGGLAGELEAMRRRVAQLRSQVRTGPRGLGCW